MKKRTIAILILMLLVLSCCVGCAFYDAIISEIEFQKQVRRLPDIEYDEDGNIVYNGCIYERCERSVIVNNNLKLLNGKSQVIAKYPRSGIYYGSINGYGIEDFGEIVYLVRNELGPGREEYIKSGFAFPDHMNLSIDDIYITTNASSTYGDSIFDSKSKELYLKDILTEVDSDKINSSEIKSVKISDDFVFVNIYFAGYKNLYLDNPYLFTIGDQLYLTIIHIDSNNDLVRKVYIINDEYQELFRNAIAELSEQ